ncbi:hypothetical protein MASR2M36_16330 [Providencia sp.]
MMEDIKRKLRGYIVLTKASEFKELKNAFYLSTIKRVNLIYLEEVASIPTKPIFRYPD